MTLDLDQIRAHFPSLQREVVYFDNPGGTQAAGEVLERISAYLTHHNANHGGLFATSIESDAVLDQARQAAADFLHAARPEEIVFGPNMTSLTFQVSRALAHWLQPGDEIAVTRLDHDANITPWARIAEERGCTLRWVDFQAEDGTLDPESLKSALEHQPRLLAFGFASNALGTINNVEEITHLAHDAGALVYIDAVQYAPHGPIDVQALDCDFLACSAYKFLARTSACCTASTNISISCPPTGCGRRRPTRPASSRPARRTTKGWRGCWARSNTWPGLVKRLAASTGRSSRIATRGGRSS